MKTTAAKESGVALNFNVSKEFRREFKLYAVLNNLKQKEVLELAFAALKLQPRSDG